MAYRKIKVEELQQWIAEHPGGSYRIGGKEYKAPKKQPGMLESLLTTLSKPIRAIPGSAYSAITGKETGNPFLTDEEEAALYNNPESFGVKNALGLGSYLLPVGAAKGVTGLKAVGQAAGRGVLPGAMGGVAFSEEGKELGGALTGGLTGGLFAGALQGVGEVGRKIASTKLSKSGMGTYLDDIDDVIKVDKLPKQAKSALKKLSKSAGFNDPALSESKNILNYIKNRQLAGTTPGQTLENMTQEFAKASQLKQEGLEEIGGLSRSYLEQAQKNFDDAIRYKGLSLDKEGTGVYNDIRKTFLTGPQDAKSLDDILMKWNEAGRNAKGAQKMGLTGLYSDASKSLRDVMRTTNPGGKYDVALKQLSQVLGLDDEGVVAAAAKAAEKTGFNVPMFQNAGVSRTDIKAPFIANTMSKAQAGIGQRQLERAIGSQATQGSAQMPQLLQQIIGGAQRTTPAVAGMMGGQQEPQQPIQPQQQLPQGVDSQGINPLNLMLAQEVLNGNISATEANAVLSLLGMGPEEEVKEKTMTESQRDYQLAAEAIQQAKSILEQSGGAGKLATLGGNISGFFGSTTASSEYRSALETATAFLRKALIGSGQSASELKNLNLPKPTDEPNIARQKIATLIPLLLARAGLQEY